MTELASLLASGSARAIGAAIATGKLTSTEATSWYLHRIEQFNTGAQGINCVRSISRLALEEAARADAELAAGHHKGPLHGVPYLVKDNVFTLDGSFASAGSRALAEFIPPYEARLVERLREAGAVLLGKTNLTEFADFVADTMPSEFSGTGGVVRHPLGFRYERGQGSSIGSAAAVAAGFCAFAIGSETQNSIQAPAIHSSITGFKPTVGRVSRHGLIPLVPSQDSPGPLTRTVEDALLVFQAIAGADMKDTATLADFPDKASVRQSAEGLRIGIPRRFIADSVLTDTRKEAFEQALALLTRAGAVIVDPCDLPAAEQLNEVRSCVFRTEFRESLNSLLATLQPCGITSMQDIISWNNAHPEAIPYGQSLLEAANASPDLLSAQYISDRRHDVALSLDAGILAALKSGNVDVLLSPMAAAAKCTGKAGAPVVAIPAGQDEDGLPFGITLFAAPGDDYLVLQAAKAVESVIGKRLEPDIR
ncbi:amidase family protein [Erwinia sp. MMLR14_017]|uniref:amidase family protein n=1 Tax=Erwinia sp. MMLR14_017 TaxID=3093842 RepID=UPI00298F61D9|nr:amidase family protein [Erwinia sp. MMLR14_017]MDW8845086.1 amidase family protein [Erwinia sp. MMLR14_017]